MTDEIEVKAREFYEQSRKSVSGRPRWEKLNPADPYDMGMKEHAFEQARSAISKASTSIEEV
jgi:hypothetical protein